MAIVQKWVKLLRNVPQNAIKVFKIKINVTKKKVKYCSLKLFRPILPFVHDPYSSKDRVQPL